MNVLIIAQYFPPDLGGSATRAYNVAKGLVLNGCNVTVISAFPHYPHGNIPSEYRWKPFKVEWMGRIKVIRTFILPLESRGFAKRVLLFLTFIISSLFVLPFIGEVDVIWVANPDVVAIISGLVYGRIKRRPVVSNVDDLAIEDLYDLGLVRRGSLVSKLIEIIARFCYNNVEALTPISPAYVNVLSEKYWVKREKIHVVYGGVDLNVFRPKVLSHRFLDGGGFTVLYSGAFSVAYDFDQVLRAAKILELKRSDVRFVLQGKGELAGYIKRRIGELGLRNVLLIDKLLSREEVAELLNEADVLIQPLGDYGKPHMGVSTKLYEYQAVGKPIICCSSGMPGVYVSKTRSGIVIKPGDYEALAEAVLYLKSNPKIARQMGENGKEYVERHVSMEKIGQRMLRIFDVLMERAN